MDNPAETYERYMVPVLFAPSAERMVELARPRPGQRVLDLAAGTGDLAARIWPRIMPGGRLVLGDINADMLALGRNLTIDGDLGGAHPYFPEYRQLVAGNFGSRFAVPDHLTAGSFAEAPLEGFSKG